MRFRELISYTGFREIIGYTRVREIDNTRFRERERERLHEIQRNY